MKLKANSVAAQQAAREPRPLDRALAFLDPLFRRTALIVKRHNALAAAAHVGDDEADARKQLSGMPLDLGNDSTRLSPNFPPDSGNSHTTDARRAVVGRLGA